MSKLEDVIKRSSQQYYSDGSSEYTDAEFDDMLSTLKDENPNSELLTDVGHGYDIEKDSTCGTRKPHKYGNVVGLEKCHNWKELGKQFKDSEASYYITPKLDGMSILCYFEKGKFVYALTRGSRDGATGIDVSDKVRTIIEQKDIFHLAYPFTGAVRGEIVMSQQAFEDISKKYPNGFDGKKPFSNPRNTTAGIINRKEVENNDLAYLNLVFYYVVGAEDDIYFDKLKDNEYGHILSWLYEMVNQTNSVPVHVTRLSDDTFEADMIEARHKLDFSRFDMLDYPTDGLVINKTFNRNTITGQIVYESQAFKFPAEQCETTVTDVRWNLTKTRYLVPVIEVEPVQLSGTTVTYATGFNANYILTSRISKGAKVTITKSGEIIPYILDVTPADDYESCVPATCPVCGEALKWHGVHIKCDNEDCPNAHEQDVLEWINYLVPMDNFGDKLRLKYLRGYLGNDFTVEDLMIKAPRFDMSRLLGGAQDIMFLEFISKLLNDKFKLDAALKALNIPRLGDITATNLAMNPDIVDKMINALDEFSEFPLADSQKLLKDATTTSIVNNLWKFRRLKMIRDRIITTQPTFKGKVAITGKLSVRRSDFEEELKLAGYIAGSISKDCKFLITDNPDSSSSKNMQADKWGIEKITESDFRAKYL